MKILLVNSVYGFGSTGKIVASLNNIDGINSLAVYGRKRNTSNDTNVVKITNLAENIEAASKLILFNKYSSCNIATDKLTKIIDEFKPDIIHLHNLHGYYINFDKLLQKLLEYGKPVVWTLHDCWPMTGYCCHFDYANCDKYMNGCKNCNKDFSYPFSIFKQNIDVNFQNKINKILELKNILTFVTPSNWLKNKIISSKLSPINTVVINNGINIPNTSNYNKTTSFSILAVANYWTSEKGLNELKKIVPLLDDDIEVTIVGKIRANAYLKQRCRLIARTDSYETLAKLYEESYLFINPTLEDNFPTVNIESISFGTPVISYNTGGSPEIYDTFSGITIEKYDYINFADTINRLKNNYYFDKEKIINRSKNFSKKLMLDNYIKLYNKLI